MFNTPSMTIKVFEPGAAQPLLTKQFPITLTPEEARDRIKKYLEDEYFLTGHNSLDIRIALPSPWVAPD